MTTISESVWLRRLAGLALAVGLMAQCAAAATSASAAETQSDVPAITGHMNNTADIRTGLTLDELVQPFAPELYYGRSLLSAEGRKAWDLSLRTLLAYDNADDSLPRDGSGNTIVRVDYAAAGIRPTPDDCTRIQSYLVRNEARLYHLKDWKAEYRRSGDAVTQQTFYVGNGVQNGTAYHDSLLRTESKVTRLLSVLRDDMTVYQQIWAVQKAYQDSVTYRNAGSPSDLRGALNQGQAICGGYSKGWMYLLQRMGIEAIWVNGYAAGAHAWNYLKVNGAWYMADTTWGGKNWWLNGADYATRLTRHDHYGTFSPMPELAAVSIPQAWGDYPSIWLNVRDTALVDLHDDDPADDLVSGYGNVYGEDLSGSLAFAGDLDPDTPGRYSVTVTVSDSHGNRTSADSSVTVADIRTKEYSGNESIRLYYGGRETRFTNGYSFKEHWNGARTLDLPDADHRVFEAKVGILASVRENVKYGSNARVAFRVEFLAGDGSVLSTRQTKDFTWWTPAEQLSYEVPDDAAKVRFTHLAKGAGNNHSGYADVRVLFYDDPVDPAVDAEVGTLLKLFGTVGLKANGVYPTRDEWIALDRRLNDGRTVPIRNPAYTAIMRRMAAMDEAGITDAVLSDRRVKDAMAEFLAYADWVDRTYA